MTVDEFRSLALAFAGAVEAEHMNHPDFRVEGKIFASLGYPNQDSAMVKLTPEQQAGFLQKASKVFNPCNGVWGQRGATHVHLPLAKPTLVRSALKAAYGNLSGKPKKK